MLSHSVLAAPAEDHHAASPRQMAPNAARYRSLISRMPDHGHAQCGEARFRGVARHLGPLLRQRRQEAGQGEDRTPARQGLDPSKVQPSRSPEQASRAKRRPGDGSAEVKIQDSQDCPACAFCHRLFPTLDAVAVSHIYSSSLQNPEILVRDDGEIVGDGVAPPHGSRSGAPSPPSGPRGPWRSEIHRDSCPREESINGRIAGTFSGPRGVGVYL